MENETEIEVDNGYEVARAYKKGRENGEHHPLTLYIEQGEFLVCNGRETLFQTESGAALAAFIKGWRKVYLDEGENDLGAFEGVANSQTRMGI